VQDADLARVADELYGLSPDDFRAARDERAAQVRASGDRDLARAITALRRPVVSAWLVNLLAREDPGQMGELLALGESLRDAQQSLDGDRLRELSAERRRLVTAMVGEAKRLAAGEGRAVTLQVEREVEATLQAALADPGAAADVAAGRLASPLSYAGLGGGEAVTGRRESAPSRPVTVPAAERKVPGQPAARADGVGRGQGPQGAARREAREAEQREVREAAAAERKEREAAAVRQAALDAADAVAGARAALDDAERETAGARAAQEAVRQRAEQLDRELSEALAEQSRATRVLREAQRARDAAARALDAATKRLARAQQAVSRLG
jgi:hypothetical protein